MSTVDLILFGSRARGDHREDSDVDVLIVSERLPEAVVSELEPFALEHGGKLDLFWYACDGDTMQAVFDPLRLLFLNRSRIREIDEHGRLVSVAEVVALCEVAR